MFIFTSKDLSKDYAGYLMKLEHVLVNFSADTLLFHVLTQHDY